MSLSRYKVRPSIAVSDIARAAEFYERRSDGNTIAIEERTAG